MLFVKLFFRKTRFNFINMIYNLNLISENSYHSFIAKELKWIKNEEERLGIKK